MYHTGGVRTVSTNSNRRRFKMKLRLTVILLLLLTTQAESREIFLVKSGNWEEFYLDARMRTEFAENSEGKLLVTRIDTFWFSAVRLGKLHLMGAFRIDGEGNLWIKWLDFVIRYRKDGRIAYYWSAKSGTIYADNE